jgi:hypothetical protein
MTSFFVTLIAQFTISFWRDGFMEEADLDTFNSRLTAGDIIRDSVGTSEGMIMQNSIADDHPMNVDATDVSGTHWQAIHAIPGATNMPAKGATTPLVYYRRPAQASNGTYIMNGSVPYEDEYVLYLDGTTKTLRMRSLANPFAPGDRLQISCPDGAVTSSCPADKTVAYDVSSVTMRYFSRTGNTINWTSITDPDTGSYVGPDFTAVEVAEFTINLTKKPFLQTTNATQNSTIIRVALRNA